MGKIEQAIFVVKTVQAVYQAIRDVRYVRFLLAFAYWLGRLFKHYLCRLRSGWAPRPRPVLWRREFWVYTPSLAWETDRNSANPKFPFPPVAWQQKCTYGLQAYDYGNARYYVDSVEYKQRLRFYLAVREAGSGGFFAEARKLGPGYYIASHKSGAGDYYEECMSGCPFRAVKCNVIVDPDPPMPNFSRILALVALANSIAGYLNIVSLAVVGVVAMLDCFRGSVEPWYSKKSAKLKRRIRGALAYFQHPGAEYLIGLLESMNESLVNCSQYTFGYATLENGYALLGNGSRVHKKCKHRVMEDADIRNNLEENGDTVVNVRSGMPQQERSTTLDSVQIEFDRVHIRISWQNTIPAASSSSQTSSSLPSSSGKGIVEEPSGSNPAASSSSQTSSSLPSSSGKEIIEDPSGSNPEPQPQAKRVISLLCEPNPEHRPGRINLLGSPSIDMGGEDEYEKEDWEFVKRRMEFAAKYNLFPLWSLDDHKAHCKQIKYDFFNGRYHKGCVIRDIEGTRVVGGDFELDTVLEKENPEIRVGKSDTLETENLRKSE